MKKMILFFVLIQLIVFTACSFSGKVPNSGTWYCEELKTSINFSLLYSPEPCVKIYNKDGTYEIADIHIDFGTGIYFYRLQADGTEDFYMMADFKLKKEKFIVTSRSDNTEYIFLEIDDKEKMF